MLLFMKRTQTTTIGKFFRGQGYSFDLKDPRQKAVFDDFLARKMAEETTLEKLREMAAKASKIDLPATAEMETQGAAEKLLSDAKTEAEKLLSDAQADADKLRDDAKTEAEKLLSDAQADADKLRDDAKTEAEKPASDGAKAKAAK